MRNLFFVLFLMIVVGADALAERYASNPSAPNEPYWQCQCFESELSEFVFAGTSLVGIDSLKQAEDKAYLFCKQHAPESYKEYLARCLRFVKSDH